MERKKIFAFVSMLAWFLCVAAAEEMKISLIRGHSVIDVYGGDSLYAISATLRNARE